MEQFWGLLLSIPRRTAGKPSVISQGTRSSGLGLLCCKGSTRSSTMGFRSFGSKSSSSGFVCMYARIYVCLVGCLYVCVYIYIIMTHTDIYIYMPVHSFVHIWMTHIRVYIHIYIYIYASIHIHAVPLQ